MWNSLTHKFQTSEKLRDTTVRMNRLGVFSSHKESRFSLTVKQRFENTNSRPIYDRRSIQKLNETIESQEKKRNLSFSSRRRIDFDDINNFLMNNYWKQNLDLREAHEKSLNEVEELEKFQGSIFDTIATRKLVEDRDTIH